MNRDFENDNEFDIDGAGNRGQSRKRYGAGAQGAPASGQSARRPVSADDGAGPIPQSGGAGWMSASRGQRGGSQGQRSDSQVQPGRSRGQWDDSQVQRAGSQAQRGDSQGQRAGSQAQRGDSQVQRAGSQAQRGDSQGQRGGGQTQPGRSRGQRGDSQGQPGGSQGQPGRSRRQWGDGQGQPGDSQVQRTGSRGQSGDSQGQPGGSQRQPGGSRTGAVLRPEQGGTPGLGASRGADPDSGRTAAGAGRAASRPASSSGQGKAAGQTAAARTERPRYAGESGGQGGRSEWVELPAGGQGGERQGRSGPADRKGGKKIDPQVKAVKRKRRIIITMIILECFTLCLIFGARYVIGKMNMIQRDNSFSMKEMTNPNLKFDVDKMEGYWTIALFGVDSRDNSLGRGNNADVNMICNVNRDTGEIKLVSVFRDTYLSLDDKGTYNKINQAYFVGGPEQAIKALNKNLDLQIDDYAVFNWKAVVDAINILGGVDIELSKAEFYYINAYITETVKGTGVGSHQLTHAGMNHLDGVQAVAYARLRKMDTDFARTERQRKVIELAFDKLKKADFAKVNNVMEVVLGQIQSSIDLNDLIPAAKNLTKYYIGDTTGFPQARDDVNMGRKGDCVIPATLESNVPLLHQFLFGEENYEPSDMVKQISAKISADTGLYKQAKPIDHVGTNGGYIPKPTQAPKPAAEDRETTKADEGTVETSGIIDGEGEGDLELETDEFGNEIDPPEGGQLNPSQGYPGSGQGYPGGGQSYPGGGQNYPGGGQNYPGGGQNYPGGGQNYPGGGQNYPGSSQGNPGSGQDNTGPGQNYPGGGQSKPGGTSPTSPSSGTAPYPGAPGSPTSPDNTSGPGAATAAPSTAYPGSGAPGGGNPPTNPTMSTKPVKPAVDNNSGGPNSVITGPGGR